MSANGTLTACSHPEFILTALLLLPTYSELLTLSGESRSLERKSSESLPKKQLCTKWTVSLQEKLAAPFLVGMCACSDMETLQPIFVETVQATCFDSYEIIKFNSNLLKLHQNCLMAFNCCVFESCLNKQKFSVTLCAVYLFWKSAMIKIKTMWEEEAQIDLGDSMRFIVLFIHFPWMLECLVSKCNYIHVLYFFPSTNQENHRCLYQWKEMPNSLETSDVFRGEKNYVILILSVFSMDHH